jgi:crossover junction endodeoxyribonuclease RuvC
MSLAGRRILGIDPGLRITGYACIEAPISGPAAPVLVEAGIIRLDARTPLPQRLVELERDITELIGRARPTVLAVEKLYAHYAHPATAIVMAHARGLVLWKARSLDLRIVELGATKVKKALTGNGHAGKAQMQDAARLVLGLPARPEPADVADAIAIALCAARRV